MTIAGRPDHPVPQHHATDGDGSQHNWASLTAVRPTDELGGAADNIDLVLVQYDERNRITASGGVEVHAVCLSGNIRDP